MKRTKKHKAPADGFTLVPNTAGKILNGIFHNEEKQELRIEFATGEVLKFKPLDEEETLSKTKQ